MSAAQAKENTNPSITAFSVALMRAQHQIVDNGAIFSDPFAIPILGKTVDVQSLIKQRHPSLQFPRLRQFVAARSRFAEDAVANAVKRGVRQVVVLGAGLDTFGIRNPHARKKVRVFEVDRPISQQWKQRFLKNAKLKIPPTLSFVPVNFETESFLNRLAAAGFNTNEPAFFTWLGVVFYLSRQAIRTTLSTIAKVPEAEVVLDYAESPDSVPANDRRGYQGMIDRATKAGEPWVSFFTPAQMKMLLTRIGYAEIEQLGPEDVGPRFAFRGGNPIGAHLVRARKLPGSTPDLR